MNSSIIRFLFTVFLTMIFASCVQNTPPQAKKEKKQFDQFDHIRIDNYYWLKERDNPEVLEYLKAENQYAYNSMAHTQKLEKKLYEELISRIEPEKITAPYRLNEYYYYTRYEENKEYPIYCRKKSSLDAPEEIMIDVNKLAEGHSYCRATGLSVSADNNMLAYGLDTLGRRKYVIYFKNLATGDLLSEKLENTTGQPVWANDNKSVFYTVKDHTLRPVKVNRHILNTSPDNDITVYHEPYETFSTYVSKSRSQEFIFIESQSTLSTEFRYLNADTPMKDFQVIQPREKNLEYSVEHIKDSFVIRTNYQAKNFRLVKTSIHRSTKQYWRDIVPVRENVLLEDFTVFDDYLVIDERANGLTRLRVMETGDPDGHYISFEDAAYTAYIDKNPEIDSDVVRFGYSSLTTPGTIYDYDMKERNKILVKQDHIPGGFNSQDYRSERIFAEADDKTLIPVSLVYRKDLDRTNPNPLYMMGYGSYGSSYNPRFRSHLVSLLDRGFIFAIAHIRGGQEMGREWYEQGKLFHKKNTFTDFINCAEFLIRAGYTSSDKFVIRGGSAGGLLIGAVINMQGDLFRAAIAAVPFVDVITTMLDPDIPLTTSEYDEWGDPNNREYFEYILSYSPYDNVARQSYPALLVTTSLHDSQVQYWEPAKWVAKLRDMKTDDNLLILTTDFESGHSGAPGRYEKYKLVAFQFAFILDQVGISE